MSEGSSGSPSGKASRLATAFEHDDHEEDESKVPFRTKLWNYLEEAMEESAPAGIDGQDMKTHGILIPITMIYVMVFFAALFYFAIQGAIQIERQHFLSAERQDGSICDTVATYITATYEADLNGAWSTFSGTFKVNSSYYSLKFTGGPVDKASYRSNMIGFQTKLNALGAKAANRDVTYTLLAMSALELTSTDVTGLAFSSNVVSDVTFGSLTPYSWAIVNYQGRCYGEKNSTYVAATYDKAEKSIVIAIDGIKVSKNDSSVYTEPCPSQAPNLYKLFGYKSDKSGSQFKAKFEVRSLATVISINLGIFRKEDFDYIDLGIDSAQFGLPPGFFYIDAYYVDFQPFFCLSDAAKGNSGPDICFLTIAGIKSTSTTLGDVLAYTLLYPTMTSYGDFESPTTKDGPCTCPRDRNSPSCNQPDHLISMFYDTGVDTGTGVANNDNTVAIGKYFQQFLVADSVNGDITLNYNAYPIGLLSTQLWYNNKVSSSNLTSAFNTLCPDKKCAAFVVEMSKANAFTPLTKNGLNLYALTIDWVKDSAGQDTLQPLLMCSDLISQPAVMNKLVASPPVELTMPFYNCHNTLATALQTSIGVAQGYASLASTLIVSVITMSIVLYCNRFKAKTPEDKVASSKVKQVKRQQAFERSILSIAQNQHALAPLILELVAASKDPRVEDTYAKFCYNQRRPPKPTRKALMIHDPPAEFVQEHKETITTFRETGETSAVKSKTGFTQQEEDEEEEEYEYEYEDDSDQEDTRIIPVDKHGRRIALTQTGGADPWCFMGSVDSMGDVVAGGRRPTLTIANDGTSGGGSRPVEVQKPAATRSPPPPPPRKK